MESQDILKDLSRQLEQVGVNDRIDPAGIRNNGTQTLERRQISELERQLERVIDSLRIDDRLPQVLFRLANMHFQEGDLTKAVTLYEYTLRVDSDQIPVWVNLAKAYATLGRRDDAIMCLKNAIELDKKNTEALVMLAMMALEDMKTEECKKYLRIAAENAPDHVLVHYCKGMLYLRTGSIDAAIACFKKAIQSDSRYISAYIAMGQTYLNRRRYDEAIEILQLGLRHDPNHPVILATLGDASAEKGLLEQALEYYAKALALRPNDIRLWIRKGDLHRLQKSYKEAARAYESAVNADPNNIEAWIKAAQMFLLLNERETAIECLNTARGLDPKNSQVAHERGVAFLTLGRLEEALRDFDDAFSLSPDNPTHLYYRAQALERLGRHDEARRTWEVAYELFKEAGNSTRAAECYARMQRYQITKMNHHSESSLK